MKKSIYSLATAAVMVMGAAPVAHASSIFVSVGGIYLGSSPGAPLGAPSPITYLGSTMDISQAVTLDFKALDSWIVTSTAAGDQSGLSVGGSVEMDAGPETDTTLSVKNGVGGSTLWEKEWSGTYQGQAAYFSEELTNISAITRSASGQLQIQLTGTLYVTKGSGDYDGPFPPPGNILLAEAPAIFYLQVQNQNGPHGTWTTTFLDTAGTAPAPGPVPGVGLLGSAALLGFFLTAKVRASRG
ncbi:MAG: hypothetical protein WAK01_01525 [Methylocystis sp.]